MIQTNFRMRFPKANTLSEAYILKRFLSILLITLSLSSYGQRAVPPKPKLATSVYDQADLLNEIQEKELEQKLLNYADSTSTQIVVATIPSLEGEDIGIYSVRWAQAWGIGQSKEDNGIFVLVSKNDRKLWIAPGYGAEIKLTAGVSGTIIRNIITPEFKAGNFYSGLDKGTTAIMEVLEGTFKNNKKRSNSKDMPFENIFIIFFIFLVILKVLRRNKRGGGGGKGGNRSRAGSLLDVIILSNMGRGGFSGGGGSFSEGGSFGGGGGFGGGFGGGGFSGGGAGGSW